MSERPLAAELCSSFAGSARAICHDGAAVPSRLLRLLTGSSLAFAVFVSTSARAEEVRPIAGAIRVAPTEPCLTTESLAKGVAQWLGRGTVDARLVVEVTSVPPPRVAFVLKDEDGVRAERDFPDPPPQCADRLAVVSFAVAVAIDATVLEKLGAPKKEPAPLPELPPPAPLPPLPDPEPPPPPPSVVPSPVEPAEPKVVLGATLEGWAAFGLLPDPAFAGYAGGQATWPVGVELRLGGFASSEVTTRVGDGNARVRVAGARADGCFVPYRNRLEARGCLGLGLGRLVASGTNLDANRSTGLPWVGLFARADVRFEVVGPLGVHAGLDGLAALARPRLGVQEADGSVTGKKLPIGGGTVVVGLDLSLR